MYVSTTKDPQNSYVSLGMGIGIRRVLRIGHHPADNDCLLRHNKIIVTIHQDIYIIYPIYLHFGL